MNLAAFKEPQQQALLDLVVLGMYADGHLARAEDARIQHLLGAMGLISEYERHRCFDAAVARTRPHAETSDGIRTHAATLAEAFPQAELRQQIAGILEDLLASDRQISPKETEFLAAVKAAFGMA